MEDAKKEQEIHLQMLEQFEIIWENVESGIVIIDAETREVLYANPAAVSMFGDVKEKRICHICYKFFGRHECPILDLNQTLDHTELQFIRPDGTIIPILKSATQSFYQGRPVLLESFNDLSHVKEAEAQRYLLEMGERTQILLDTSPLAAHVWNENLEMIDCNQAAVRMFSLSDKHEYIKRYFDLTPEFQPDGSRSIDRRAQLIDETFKEGYRKIEWMCQTLDGEPIPVEKTLVSIEDKGRKLVAEYCRDLREQKRMIQEIRQRDQMLNTVVSNYSGVIWSVNKDETISLFNGLYLNKIGVAPDFLEGKKLDVARNKNRHHDIIENVRKTFTGEPQDWISDIDGKKFHTRTVPIYDENGQISDVVGSSDDVTDMMELQKELQNALSQLELERYTLQSMFDSVPDLIFCKDLNSIYTRCNESFLKHFNLNKEDVIGKNDIEGLKLPLKTAEELKRLDHQTVAERRVVTYEEHLPTHDGSERLFETNKIPLMQDGEVVGVMGIARDITERKAMEQAALSANKAKSAFLSTMSHEIRTPMNAILGITEIQLQKESLNPDVKKALEKIYTSGDMLLGIINDILDLSKIEAGKLELLVNEYQIASLVSDTAQLNMMRIGSKLIEFDLYVDENMPANLSGDELRVKQILNNLLSNAFKYTTQGTVKLSVTAESDMNDENMATLVIVVSDTGQGMTQDQVGKLFDEYARFNLDTNRTTEGTGLGMSITNNLIRLMNGEIFIESEPGKGSVFTVRLPQGRCGDEILGQEVAANLQQFRTSSRAQMKRVQISREPMPYGSVLIVDDVETNIYVARGLLSPYGLKIDSADSGFSCIEKIKNGKLYDIIFMDHMMPKMDGIEATKIIRSMGYDRPIVALTANAVSGQSGIFLSNGFDDFISKPIDIRQLNAILNKLIRDKQPPEVLQVDKKSARIDQTSDNAPPSATDPQFAPIFIRDASKALEMLEPLVAKNDFGNEANMRAYIINVHGMKSALAVMGKTVLSAAAGSLEIAARQGQLETIASETPAFISALQAYVDDLTQQADNANGEMSQKDEAYLREKLLIIKTACEQYDESAVNKAIKELNQTTWPKPVGELLNQIARHLLHSDFDEVVAVVDENINRKPVPFE